MRYLGLDLGTKTLGIAISDRLGVISNPYKTIRYNSYDELVSEIKKIVLEEDIKEVALGLPKNMDNSIGEAGKRSISFKELLDNSLDIPINLVDERLSTVEAEKYLLNADVSREKRKAVIDAVAASVILNTYLRMKGNDNNE